MLLPSSPTVICLRSSLLIFVLLFILCVTECVIDCLKFVSSHALGFTIMALSSYDPKVRAAAYHVLSSFYHHLEGARFREKRQVSCHCVSLVCLENTSRETLMCLYSVKQLQYLMDTVRNGVRQQNLRLPFILTTYITKVAQQMLRPGVYL